MLQYPSCLYQHPSEIFGGSNKARKRNAMTSAIQKLNEEEEGKDKKRVGKSSSAQEFSKLM